jgi:polysaccharide biosynthesis transport protein
VYQLTSAQPSKSAPGFSVPGEFQWSRLWRAFLQRRRIFIATFVICFAAMLVYTLLEHKMYTTHVKLIAGSGGNGVQGGQQSANSTLPLLNALLAATGVQTSETYAELFQEQPVAERVISDLKLDITPTQFLSHVKVLPIQNTTLLDLAVTWPNRDMSANIANDFSLAFVDRERSLVASQADSAIQVLSQQLPKAQQQAVVTRTQLTNFETSNNLADVQTQTLNTLNAAAAIDTKIASAQVDMQQAKAQLSVVQGELGHTGPTTSGQTSVAPNPVLASLQSQLAQATVQLEVAQQQYTDEHPSVIALKRQVAELRRQMASTPETIVAQANMMPNPLFQSLSQQAAQLQGQVAADSAQLSQLQAQHAGMTPQIKSLPAKTARLLELQRNEKMSEDVLAALQQKLNDANISKATALGDVTITQPASASNASVTPNKILNIIAALVLSTALGIIATILAYLFDRRIRDVRQIEDELELPVLAAVPMLSALQNRFPVRGSTSVLPAPGERVSAQIPEEPWLRANAVESFLELVTSLRYSSSSDRPIRCITITSPAQGDGKSTIALNAAITMAHIEPRVLLIDADLRRPSLHSKLNRELGTGLSDVLVGIAQLSDAIVRTDHDGLDLLTSGTRTPNSVKLIQSKRFDDILGILLQTYNTIIIDAPALAPVIDAAILAAKSDGTVMVVAIDKTDATAVRAAIQKLHGLGANNLLGTVANRIRPTRRLGGYEDYFFNDLAASVDGPPIPISP